MRSLVWTTSRRPIRSGFTLIEAAITTMIIGVGVVALMGLIGAGTSSNVETAKLTTGIQLANTIRDLTLGVTFVDPQAPAGAFGPDTNETLTGANPYDDIDDFNGASYNPPIDARRAELTEYENWRQEITVQSINPLDLTSSAPVAAGSTEMNRVTVRVKHNEELVCEQSWIVVFAAD